MKIRMFSLLACLLFSGCGQSGDLFLPPEAPTTTVPDTATPTEESEENDEETRTG
ncbi:MAG: lipoprotein [Woeseiaceae bacterium]